MEPKIKNWTEKIDTKIEDSVMQVMQFKFFTDINQIKKLISETQFKTLEEYTGKTFAELNKVKPGVCEAYDALIVEFQNPDLTMERFTNILDEVYKVTRLS